MILLDTNVVSELMRVPADKAVERWISSIEGEAIFLSSITVMELLFGVSLLPDGKRKTEIARLVNKTINSTFADSILPFDDKAAQVLGPLRAKLKTQGKNIGILDLQIAAISLTQGATIATRNVKDFEATGVALINPFQDLSTENQN